MTNETTKKIREAAEAGRREVRGVFMNLDDQPLRSVRTWLWERIGYIDEQLELIDLALDGDGE